MELRALIDALEMLALCTISKSCNDRLELDHFAQQNCLIDQLIIVQ